jgi:uncharacterized Ntn-hydrolase superfamily protein
VTWSIIARDHITGEIGIAVATKFFAVGARVPFIEIGAGALATQALINPLYGRVVSPFCARACQQQKSCGS